MDFVSYPPEINSARMYAGAGAGPMLAAAEAWDALAKELHSAANSYQAVISELTGGPWLGPASASMSAAAAPYAAWLRVTAAQADESSTQAKSAAAAYQTAFSATVPPMIVAANRAELATLVATNVLGVNTQAIALTEAQYGEMWAQDLAAMYGYAAASASSTALTPFDPPPQTTNPAGLIDQAAGPTGGAVESMVQQVLSAAPGGMQSAAAVAAEADPLALVADLFTVLLAIPALYSLFIAVPANVVGTIGFPVSLVGVGAGLHTDEIISGWNGEEPYPGTDRAPVKPFPAPLLNLPAGTVPPPSVAAGMGEASIVGDLSVPPTWTVATPAVRPVAYTLPGTVAAADAVPAAEVDSGSTLGEMALAGMAGRVMAQTVGSRAGSAARGARAAAPAAAGAVSVIERTNDENDTAAQDAPRAVVTGVAAELREFAKLRDEGLLTDDEYAVQRKRLLGC